MFYVAQIMVVHEEEYNILFMRKTTGRINKLTFSFPKQVDAVFIRKKDAILVLPPLFASQTQSVSTCTVRGLGHAAFAAAKIVAASFNAGPVFSYDTTVLTCGH